jgi:hypothetical protein
MKKLILLMLLLTFTTISVFANCVIRSKSGKYYWFEGLNCERDFIIREGESCWNVASPPSPKNTITAIEVRNIENEDVLFVKVNGVWEEVSAVSSEFVLPSTEDCYETYSL